MSIFSAHEREVLARLAEVVVPAGARTSAGGPDTVVQLERYLDGVPPWSQRATRALVWAVDAAAIPYCAKPFSKLGFDARTRLVDRWMSTDSAPPRHALRALIAGLKSSHFDCAERYAEVGVPYGVSPAVDENPRWLAQITDGRAQTGDETIEVDVVVVGTGAGGAPLAYELASRGHAVLMLEEGRYFRRSEFTGHAAEMTRKMYREGGMTIAYGNLSTPVWAGKTVGGTTTVNSGTCYRTPERTFRRWRDEFGLSMFSNEAMQPYFERVEHILGIAPGAKEHLGGVARVVARGADKLGYVHKALRRNAPDCDGQGVCCFGCPTGAKRSTDVSYVPMALDRGAALYASTRVERVMTERGRATGVVARTRGGATLTVHARATVISCGTLMTPLLLGASEIGNRSGQLGRNLSIHPAAAVHAMFDERIDMHRGIPQGYAVEQFAEEGLMLEGASMPLDVTAIAVSLHGRRFVEVMERYHHLASFGYMIQDSSRGRVYRGPGGRLLMTYHLGNDDVRRMHRCAVAISEIFMAAGATSVFPGVHGFDELRSHGDLERLRGQRVRAGDFEVTAYHPLGTARMGTDPSRSVVAPDHEMHDVRDLYVVDGSVVPSSLGVNPQVTIMSMATRAAELLDRRLSSRATRERTRSDALEATA